MNLKLERRWEQVNQTPKTLEEIFEGHPESLEIVMREIERVKQNEKIVGIDPESWLAKEVLWQGRKMIDINHKLMDLQYSINRLHYQVNKQNQKSSLFKRLFKKS
jgi:hypothetical protein